jgi:hypothetical protein
MRRPLDWLVVAISLTFLMMGRSMTARVESPANSRPVLELPSGPVWNAQVLRFEPAGAVAVPASLRRERTLEFGYVRLDSGVLD